MAESSRVGYKQAIHPKPKTHDNSERTDAIKN